MPSIRTQSSHTLHKKQRLCDGRNVDKEVMCEGQFIIPGRVGRLHRHVSYVCKTAVVAIEKSFQTVFISAPPSGQLGDRKELRRLAG